MLRLAILCSHPVQYEAPLYRALVARGVELDVLFCHDHGVRPSYDPGFGQDVAFDVPLLDGYRHRFLRNVARRPGLRFWGQVNPGVLRELRGDHDAILVHGYGSVTTLLALLAPRGGSVATLLVGDSNPFPRRGIVRRAAKHVFLRSLFSRVDQFVTIGALNARYYGDLGVPPERMTWAPLPVDTRRFAMRAREARARGTDARRALLGLPEGKALFMFCGKMVEHKRPGDAVAAVAHARRYAECGLVMVGSGPLEPALRAEVASRGLENDVHFLGFQNQDRLPEIYALCDGLLVTSAWEPWGLVVNEAMACGLAVAATEHVGAAADLVRDNGFTFPVGDVEHLASGLIAWSNDPRRLAEAKAASSRLIARWGLEEAADGIVLAAERAIAHRRAEKKGPAARPFA